MATPHHADQSLPTIVICHPKRTPVGRYGGALKNVPAEDLASTVVTAVMKDSGLDPAAIDDLILGQASPSSAAPALGRIVALNSGLGERVPGMQLDRRCGSGLQAVTTAAAHIAAGAADLIIAGGAESMSQTEYAVDGSIRWGVKGGAMELHDRLTQGREQAGGKNHPIPGGMIETAENLRREFSIPRDKQDELAVRSHQRAANAQQQGFFDAEIVPVRIPQQKGDDIIVDKDEHIRPETSMDSVQKLRAVRSKMDDDATVTAGNASGQNDGAAAMIVTTEKNAEKLGLAPAVKLVGWAVAGVAPETMGIGPVAAVDKLFQRLQLSFDDIDLIELNEAFAAQALACLHEWGIDADDPRLNPSGSGISLGHPVGATGARMMVTAAHYMHRTNVQRGLITMCIGGGQGLAAVIEKV
ncbi:acetyl-CoA C-acetyltransferase [Corynebacterium pseudodiphtheriticum]|uniref:acetyl-CoA C-acetyltransferase n=1 Tax=Corynebacterium pseudodiphtheriticum TaxID=37637 RepID=UPI00234DE920|nr:acetyl-CoA C-acetyltransferase [Corynebacterium pseudodiphtheriticum]MDC7067335.1 acetyl-CoA C-acetyltransferase [Corynebacterium pseudodiphtheriticum]MDC7083401.1 acetyl-CoA C-acetyltransferase [Corynebacterium pseudodiphtheriticum]MDC7085623.1 acetyl-CoA C-acetyltransferase [Corynebacterium pseudodiphtheriticum]MDK4205979.1 acetyl-CoA C-acetyltransferase [Corynebacterium pseudodiphtheriticum]MDK4236251.1 acetyl-CoA C-acetyltransferase [Corynebacterium pseudodiphtheriticum]